MDTIKYQFTPDSNLIHAVSNGTLRNALKCQLDNGDFYLATNDEETIPQNDDEVNVCLYDSNHEELGYWRFKSVTDALTFINTMTGTVESILEASYD